MTFRPYLTAGLALSCFLVVFPELYVKSSPHVNGTAWHHLLIKAKAIETITEKMLLDQFQLDHAQKTRPKRSVLAPIKSQNYSPESQLQMQYSELLMFPDY